MDKWIVDAALREEARRAAAPFVRRQKKYKKELKEYREEIHDRYLDAVLEEMWGRD